MISLFATPLCKRYPNEHHIQTGRKLGAYLLDRSQREPGVQLTNVGGWHSPYLSPDELRTIPGGQDLLALIHESLGLLRAHGAFDELRDVWPTVDELADKLQAWGNVMEGGHYHLNHCHLDCNWAGVFYCHVNPADPGLLHLSDPRSPTIDGTHPALSPRSEAITPQAGQLLIFPAWLRHRVAAFTEGPPRVSVAFNIQTHRFPPFQPPNFEQPNA